MRYSIFLFIGLLLASCSSEPEPIAYGSDHCAYCKMTIVSKAHSAQMVTKKGKQIKYDAIECMVQDHLQNYEASEIGQMLVADYENPGLMLDAQEASFIIDEKINSPMGANLAAIKKASDPKEFSRVYTWDELKNHFLKEDPQNLK